MGLLLAALFGLVSFCCGKIKTQNVIPAKAGIQTQKLDSRFRGNDKGGGNDKNLLPQQILTNVSRSPAEKTESQPAPTKQQQAVVSADAGIEQIKNNWNNIVNL